MENQKNLLSDDELSKVIGGSDDDSAYWEEAYAWLGGMISRREIDDWDFERGKEIWRERDRGKFEEFMRGQGYNSFSLY